MHTSTGAALKATMQRSTRVPALRSPNVPAEGRSLVFDASVQLVKVGDDSLHATVEPWPVRFLEMQECVTCASAALFAEKALPSAEATLSVTDVESRRAAEKSRYSPPPTDAWLWEKVQPEKYGLEPSRR